MLIDVTTKYTKGRVALSFPCYQDGGAAIIGDDPTTSERLYVATVNLEIPADEGCVWLKGWSENEGIPEALVEAGVVELTGRTRQAGYCEAVEAKLSDAALEEAS